MHARQFMLTYMQTCLVSRAISLSIVFLYLLGAKRGFGQFTDHVRSERSVPARPWLIGRRLRLL